jgi:ferric-dicitrate binding protein FerR (iron transport regulator)
MSDERAPLSERRVAAVMRQLSDEHARRWAARDKARAWQRIESNVAGAGRTLRGAYGAGTWSARRRASLAAALAVAAAALLWLGLRADARLIYEVRGANLDAENGVIEARRGEATVALSDGSSILAENRSKFSVDVVGRNAALTRLVSGKLHVRVAHNEDTSYRFIAGPYEVRVVGTEFELAWDPAGGQLALAMSKGEVQVVEPSGKRRSLKAGQSLHLPDVATNDAEQARKLASPEPAAPPLRSAEPEPDPERSAPSAAAPREPAAPTWDALVAKGQFSQVVQQARAVGVDVVLQRQSASDLKALGQAARYVGERALALRAFTALRDRSRGTDVASQAAFFLARVQEEQGRPAEALRWLGSYVAEAPRGIYAAEAYGRRLSLTERVKGKAAALPLAREYLERFPEGAYAPSARALLAPR